mmetsp:Transcript_91534/g.179276  ORF Transcript_91534/g.179276 Transcript_91534/m.179276 type:complete len:288 (-) Transcript_91534:160-1023(-)
MLHALHQHEAALLVEVLKRDLRRFDQIRGSFVVLFRLEKLRVLLVAIVLRLLQLRHDHFHLGLLVLDILLQLLDLRDKDGDGIGVLVHGPGCQNCGARVLGARLLAILLGLQVLVLLALQQREHAVDRIDDLVEVARGHRCDAGRQRRKAPVARASGCRTQRLHRGAARDRSPAAGRDLQEKEATLLGGEGTLEGVPGVVAVEDGDRLADGGELAFTEALPVLPLGLLRLERRLHLAHVLRVVRHLLRQIADLGVRFVSGQRAGAILLHHLLQRLFGGAQLVALGRL